MVVISAGHLVPNAPNETYLLTKSENAFTFKKKKKRTMQKLTTEIASVDIIIIYLRFCVVVFVVVIAVDNSKVNHEYE